MNRKHHVNRRADAIALEAKRTPKEQTRRGDQNESQERIRELSSLLRSILRANGLGNPLKDQDGWNKAYAELLCMALEGYTVAPHRDSPSCHGSDVERWVRDQLVSRGFSPRQFGELSSRRAQINACWNYLGRLLVFGKKEGKNDFAVDLVNMGLPDAWLGAERTATILCPLTRLEKKNNVPQSSLWYRVTGDHHPVFSGLYYQDRAAQLPAAAVAPPPPMRAPVEPSEVAPDFTNGRLTLPGPVHALGQHTMASRQPSGLLGGYATPSASAPPLGTSFGRNEASHRFTNGDSWSQSAYQAHGQSALATHQAFGSRGNQPTVTSASAPLMTMSSRQSRGFFNSTDGSLYQQSSYPGHGQQAVGSSRSQRQMGLQNIRTGRISKPVASRSVARQSAAVSNRGRSERNLSVKQDSALGSPDNNGYPAADFPSAPASVSSSVGVSPQQGDSSGSFPASPSQQGVIDPALRGQTGAAQANEQNDMSKMADPDSPESDEASRKESWEEFVERWDDWDPNGTSF